MIQVIWDLSKNSNSIFASQTDKTDQDILVTILPEEKSILKRSVEYLANMVHHQRATIVKMDVFGGLNVQEICSSYFKQAFDQIGWPVSYVTSSQMPVDHISAIQCFLVVEKAVNRIYIGDKVIGSSYEMESAKYCVLAGITPTTINNSPSAQAQDVFLQMEKALELVDMDMTNIVRTWFYNDKITSWYDTFNAERTRFYTQRGIMNGLIPASTGMGGGNPDGAFLSAGAIALKPVDDRVTVHPVVSPLQNPALDYGSSFSRAVELQTPDSRRLYISGTASISIEGKTMFPGRVDKQIERTLEVIEAILTSRDLSFSNVFRAVGYIKRLEDAPVIQETLQRLNITLPPFPVVPNDICRDDLLFEMEVDAEGTY